VCERERARGCVCVCERERERERSWRRTEMAQCLTAMDPAGCEMAFSRNVCTCRSDSHSHTLTLSLSHSHTLTLSGCDIAFSRNVCTCRVKVDICLPGKGNSNSHGARPVHLIITMIKWIRTSRVSIKNGCDIAFRRNICTCVSRDSLP